MGSKGVASAIVFAILLAGCMDSFKASCEAQGGQVLSKSHTEFGVTSNGRITWVPSTIRFCKINGAIVDIE